MKKIEGSECVGDFVLRIGTPVTVFVIEENEAPRGPGYSYTPSPEPRMRSKAAVRTARAMQLGLWTAGLVFFFLVRAGSVWACSVCQPGDPIFSAEGTTAQRAGTYTLFLDTQQYAKESGALPHEEEGHEEGGEEHGHGTESNRTREVALFASWAPADRITLAARLPYKWIRVRERSGDGHLEGTHRNDGLGDLSMFGTAVLWRNRSVLPSTWLEARALLKLPTGEDDKKIDGEEDPHLEPGTGSWDWGLGLAGSHHMERGALYGSVFYRFNNEGSFDYQYGDVFLGTLAFTSSPIALGGVAGGRNLRIGSELNFRYAGYDESRGVRYEDSGGSIFYLSPFVSLSLLPGTEVHSPSLLLSVRQPLVSSSLHGVQEEHAVYSLGLRWPF